MLMNDEPRMAARADLCRLLAASYYQPDEAFAQERMFDAMCVAADAIDPELGAQAHRVAAAFAAEDPQRLLIDYTRLFLGPERALAQPYGSVWLDGSQPLMTDSTLAVVALYDEGGFEIAEDFRDLPDHVAAELEFLYLLLFREAQARRRADIDAIQCNAELRRRFLGEHLGRWVGPFTAAVRAGTQTAMYRELAALTECFVAMLGSAHPTAQPTA